MTSESQHDPSRQKQIDAILAEYFQARENGEAPDPETLIQQHPEFADELRILFVDPERLERSQTAAAPTLPPRPAKPDRVEEVSTLGRDGATETQEPNLLGEFGDYQLLDEIARGGMGVVFKARQTSLNRVVALKTILSGQLASSNDVARFRKEAEAAAHLDHPNIVPIHEIGEHQGQHYFSMKFVEGGSLAELVPTLANDSKKAAALMVKVAQAVHHAHQRGILHRDLKPRNVLIDGDGKPLVTDFGIAKKVEGEAGMTQTGAILGTPSYMSPEHAQADKILTTGSDVYGLGAILYELLTGRPPFRGSTTLEIILQVTNQDPEPPRKINPEIDRDLETICLKCLAKEPEKRYSSADALADDLSRWLDGKPIQARPVNRFERMAKWIRRHPTTTFLSAVCVLVLVAGLVGILSQWQQAETSRRHAEQARLDEQNARKQEKLAREKAEKAAELAKQRAKELAKQKNRIRRELHESKLLRAQLLFSANKLDQAESILWQAHFMRPDEDDQRAYWQLWDVHRKRPRTKVVRREGSLFGPKHRRLGADATRIVAVKGKQLVVRDEETGKSVASWQLTHEGTHKAALAPNAPLLAVSYLSSNDIELWSFKGPPKRLAKSSFAGGLELSPRENLGLALAGLRRKDLNERQFLRATTRLMFLGTDRLFLSRGRSASIVEIPSLKPIQVRKLLVNAPLSFSFDPISYHADQRQLLVKTGGPIEVWTLPRKKGQGIVRLELQRNENGNLVRSEPTKRGTLDFVYNKKQLRPSLVALSPDWKWLLAADSSNDTLGLWDFRTGRKISSTKFTQRARALHLSPDKRWLAVTEAKGVHLYNVPDLSPQAFFLGVRGKVTWDLDEKQMVVSRDDRMEMYPLKPILESKTLWRPRSQPSFGDILMTPGGLVLRVAPEIDGLRVWKGNKISEIAGKSWLGTTQSNLCVSPDEHYAASVSSNLLGRSICVYDVRANKIRSHVLLISPKLKGSLLVNSLAFFPGGEKLLVGTDQGLFVADVANENLVRYLPPDSKWEFTQFDFHPNGRRLVLVQSRVTTKPRPQSQWGPQYLVVLDTKTKAIVAKKQIGPLEGAPTYSSNGRYVYTRTISKLRIYDATKLEFVSELPSQSMIFRKASISPNGKLIATCAFKGDRFEVTDQIVLWDLNRQEQLTTLSPKSGAVSDVFFSPDGTDLHYVCSEKIGSVKLMIYEENMVWHLARSMPELRRQYGTDAV